MATTHLAQERKGVLRSRAALRNSFAATLRAARHKSGLRQVELADRCGISRISVARFEAGGRLPEFDLLCVLADELGIDINDFRPAHQRAKQRKAQRHSTNN